MKEIFCISAFLFLLFAHSWVFMKEIFYIPAFLFLLFAHMYILFVRYLYTKFMVIKEKHKETNKTTKWFSYNTVFIKMFWVFGNQFLKRKRENNTLTDHVTPFIKSNILLIANIQIFKPCHVVLSVMKVFSIFHSYFTN